MKTIVMRFLLLSALLVNTFLAPPTPPAPVPPAPVAIADREDGPRSQNVSVKHVDVVFSNHFDMGYTNFTVDVINEYFDVFIPRAMDVAEAFRTKNSGGENFIYTLEGPWLAALYLDCPSEPVELPGPTQRGLSPIDAVMHAHAPPGTKPPPRPSTHFRCPSAKQQARFKEALKRGDIALHAGPFNLQFELGNVFSLEFSLKLVQDLADEVGVARPTTLSQRDVPGLTSGVIPVLSKFGVKIITLGENPWSTWLDGEKVPKNTPVVWRVGKASGKGAPSDGDVPPGSEEVVLLYHPGYYGGWSVEDAVVVGDRAVLFAWANDNEVGAGGGGVMLNKTGTVEGIRICHCNRMILANDEEE